MTWLRFKTLQFPPSLQETVSALADFYNLTKLKEALSSKGPLSGKNAADLPLTTITLVTAPKNNDIRKYLCRRQTPTSFPAVQPFGKQRNGNIYPVLVVTDDGGRSITSQSKRPEQAKAFLINIHPEEDIFWTECGKNSIPSTAIHFATTGSGLKKFVGFVKDEPSKPLGVVVEGEDVAVEVQSSSTEAEQAFTNFERFHVMCAKKMST